MLLLRWAPVVALVASSPLLNTYSNSTFNGLEKRGQCSSSIDWANSAATTLQSVYYWTQVGIGKWRDGILWTDSNTLENLHNLMLASGGDQWSKIADQSYLGIAVNIGITDWTLFIQGSYDDAQWIILAFWKIADYKSARGQDGSKYITAAKKIYDIIEKQWDTSTCGGGIWWSSKKNYKNAITNELFLYVSAKGYLRGFGQKYLDNANKEWNWLKNSGMRNSQGLYNDGLNSACQNNGQTTWVYNQGVVASGLAALARANNDASLLDQAEITLDGAIKYLTTNNILRESCDNAASSDGHCNNDQYTFKGIFMKHLQYYLDEANDANRVAKYRDFIGAQASAIIHYGTGASNICGSVWYAPSAGGSQFACQTANAGIEGIVSAAKYGPC